MEEITLKIETMNKVLTILGGMPYVQSAQLIQEIKAQIPEVEKEIKKVDSELNK